MNDARSVTLVGPSERLAELRQYATQQGMQVQEVDIRGKTHNPENEGLVEELIAICQKHAGLTLPTAADLQIPLRSNKDGLLAAGVDDHEDGSLSLTAELIRTVLASHCEWYTVVNMIADEFLRSPRNCHKILSFGIGDCLTMSPFHRRQLKCTKVDIQRFLLIFFFFFGQNMHYQMLQSSPYLPTLSPSSACPAVFQVRMILSNSGSSFRRASTLTKSSQQIVLTCQEVFELPSQHHLCRVVNSGATS